MLCFIVRPNEGFAVDVDVATSGGDCKGIGTATRGVNAGVAFATSAEGVDENVIGSVDDGTATHVRARGTTVSIALNHTDIGKSTYLFHGYLL